MAWLWVTNMSNNSNCAALLSRLDDRHMINQKKTQPLLKSSWFKSEYSVFLEDFLSYVNITNTIYSTEFSSVCVQCFDYTHCIKWWHRGFWLGLIKSAASFRAEKLWRHLYRATFVLSWQLKQPRGTQSCTVSAMLRSACECTWLMWKLTHLTDD